MNTEENLRKLKPSDIVGIKMDSCRILHIWFKHPILNAEIDYEAALYAAKRQRELEGEGGESLGLFMNINDYSRLDSENFFGVSLPSAKVRKVHDDLFKGSKVKRVAVYKEEAPRIIQACARMVLSNHGKEVRVFGNKERALKWLEEGVKDSVKD